MSNKQKITEKKNIDAINYIRDSIIFTNPRYEWIIPLITKTLDDNLCDSDIDDLVDSFLSKKETKNKQVGLSQPTSQIVADDDEDSDIGIKKIKSIDKISNIGLLDVEDSIELKDGLNVFYGKNGAGKSSIYLGLCKVLGKNKRIYSNIAIENDESCCQVTFKGIDDNYYTLEWNSADENKESKVMIFDSLISNYIVDQDQENQFKMAHLKMEYFSFLYDLYQKIESKLSLELSSLNIEYDALEEVLAEKVPSVFEDDFDWDEKQIKKFDFLKEDEKKLADLNRQIKVLEKNNPEAVVRNIGNALEETENILSVFGESSEEENEDGEIEYIWEFYYDKLYFGEVNKQIEKYNKVKKAFEKSGKNKISSLISPEWIDDDTWEAFISSSIDFLNSLDEEELEKYTDETCAYCHQPLQTKEAKALMKAYQELHEEHKERLDEEAKELEEMSDLMDECIEAIDGIYAKNIKIEAEFEAIGKKRQISFDFENIKNIFQKYKTAIAKAQKIKIDDADTKAVEDFWDIYEGLSAQFKTAIYKLNKSITNKDDKIKKLKVKTESFQDKKFLYENRDNLLKYLKLRGFKEILNDKISDITPLRQAIGSLKSAFADESTLKEFKKCLKDEYDCFNFSPPEMWSIAPVTRSGVNRRVFSIGDRRLAEIFSEGERKLHALSDFFAQCELDKYKGVFIFDDPVNSLDEGNIEVVANRVMDLIKKGHQVIVFTHNLVFLNSIIDTQKDSCILIERLDNQILIEKNTKIGDKKELSNRLKEIEKRMKNFQSLDLGNVSEYELRNVYDLISGYLENYLAIIMLSDIVGRFRSNIRMNSLDKLKDLDKNLLDKMTKLYKQSSLKGSRHGMPTSATVEKPSYPQLVTHVDELKENFKLT